MINIEIKAKVSAEQQDKIREYLKNAGAWYGKDHQTDTYFKVNNGRLKLREGNIENALIQYKRPNQTGPKLSKYTLTKVDQAIRETLKHSLVESLGVLAIVKKTREIYYLDNVKIHVDSVDGLGLFMEIEARDEKETMGIDFLTEQCNKLMKEFGIEASQLLNCSYSDMLLEGQ